MTQEGSGRTPTTIQPAQLKHPTNSVLVRVTAVTAGATKVVGITVVLPRAEPAQSDGSAHVFNWADKSFPLMGNITSEVIQNYGANQ